MTEHVFIRVRGCDFELERSEAWVNRLFEMIREYPGKIFDEKQARLDRWVEDE